MEPMSEGKNRRSVIRSWEYGRYRLEGSALFHSRGFKVKKTPQARDLRSMKSDSFLRSLFRAIHDLSFALAADCTRDAARDAALSELPAEISTFIIAAEASFLLRPPATSPLL